MKAVTAEAAAHPLPALTLTRGARHVAVLPGGQALVFLRGEIQHKNLWLIDLETGAERQLTDLPPDFDIRDFDISPDGREVVLERVQERSDVVMLRPSPAIICFGTECQSRHAISALWGPPEVGSGAASRQNSSPVLT